MHKKYTSPLFQGRAEEKLKKHERRITGLENMNESLFKLTASVDRQVELNKEQQEQIKEQHGTLVEINKNLTGLNTNLEILDQRVKKLETSDSERNIDMGKLFKDIVYKVFHLVVLAWLLFYFGLK